MRPTICTFTGVEFNVFEPKPDDVRIQDIAHALARIPRFSGHTREFYSVAQHSWQVSLRCPMVVAAYGLMHDAAEAYLLDIPTPLKQHLRFALPKPEQMTEKFGSPRDVDAAAGSQTLVTFNHVETQVRRAIFERFNLIDDFAVELPLGVKTADYAEYERERASLMPDVDWWPMRAPAADLKPLPPQEAEDLFLRRFWQLFDRGAFGGAQ